MEEKLRDYFEEMVVYKALYGDGEVWVRPASMWNDDINLADGTVTKRFTLISD